MFYEGLIGLKYMNFVDNSVILASSTILYDTPPTNFLPRKE